MTIGQLAKKAGVNPQTIRYYEREGILAKPARRSGSDYRDYADASLETLIFIKNSQAAGFKLAEIREILIGGNRPGASCAKVLRLIQERSAEITEKLRTLRQFQRTLKELKLKCLDNTQTTVCPSLDILQRTTGK